MFMLSGNIHFIISFIWEHLSQRGYGPICKLAEKRAACLLNSRFTAAPNLWLGVMAFKAAAPPAGLHRLCVRSEGKVSVRWNLPLRNSFPLCLTLDTLAEHGNAFWFIFSYCFAFCCSLLLCFFLLLLYIGFYLSARFIASPSTSLSLCGWPSFLVSPLPSFSSQCVFHSFIKQMLSLVIIPSRLVFDQTQGLKSNCRREKKRRFLKCNLVNKSLWAGHLERCCTEDLDFLLLCTSHDR